MRSASSIGDEFRIRRGTIFQPLVGQWHNDEVKVRRSYRSKKEGRTYAHFAINSVTSVLVTLLRSSLREVSRAWNPAGNLLLDTSFPYCINRFLVRRFPLDIDGNQFIFESLKTAWFSPEIRGTMEAAYETVVFLAYVRDTQSIGFVNEQGSTSFCLSLKSNWNSGPEARRMPRLPPSSSLPVGRILFNPCIFTRATSRGIPRKKGRSAFWNPSRGRKRFRLGSLPESHREKRDPSSKATRSFYRLCLPLLVSISTERRSIDQGKKKKKKKKIRGARLELNRINLWDCCARVSNN